MKRSGDKVAIVLETKIYEIPIIENNVAFFRGSLRTPPFVFLGYFSTPKFQTTHLTK